MDPIDKATDRGCPPIADGWPPPEGPFGIKDATGSIAGVCDEAKAFLADLRVMLAEFKASAWWEILTKKDAKR